MTYRDGEPHLRVDLGSDNITVTGNVNILDNIRINNTEAQRIPVYLVGNTFTIPSGTVLRHSGIIIGKNTSGDGIEKPLVGGATGKIWTLCLKRLDNATKLDVWFAFTFKELA